MSSLYERAIKYAENARQALIDKHLNTNASPQQGRATWVGYDTNGRPLIKQNGVLLVARVEGNISLPPGAPVIVDKNGVISVRKSQKKEEAKKAEKKKKKKPRTFKKNRPLINLTIEEFTEEALGYELYGVTDVFGIWTPNVGEYFSTSLTCFRADWEYRANYCYDPPTQRELLYYNVTSLNRTIYYELAERRWGPTFVQEGDTSRQFWTGDPAVQSDILRSFNWYFSQRSDYINYWVHEEGNGPMPSTASPPSLPFNFEDKYTLMEDVVTGFYYDYRTISTFSSCNGRAIFHSRIIRVTRPATALTQGDSFLDSVYDPNNYDYDTALSNYGVWESDCVKRGVVVQGENRTHRFIDPVTKNVAREDTPYLSFGSPFYNISHYYGFYWSFELETETSLLRTEYLGPEGHSTHTSSMTMQQYDTRREIIADFFNKMSGGDTNWKLWQAWKESYPSFSDYLLIEDFLYDEQSWLNQWPQGLVYDEWKKTLTIVTDVADGGTNVYSAYVGDLPEGVSFAGIPGIYLPDNYNPSTTTNQDFIDSGWTAEGPMKDSGLGEIHAPFAIKEIQIFDIISYSITSNIVTITTATPHIYTDGSAISISDSPVTILNGPRIVLSGQSGSDTFTFQLTADDVETTETSGKVSPQAIFEL